MDLATALYLFDANPSISVYVCVPHSLKTPSQHSLSKNVRTVELRHE